MGLLRKVSTRFLVFLVVYNLLWTLLLPILTIVNLAKWICKVAGYDRARMARFGLFDRELHNTDLLWHCVSVGEVTAVTPLIKQLKRDYPSLAITVTTTTPTGAAQAKKGLDGLVQHCYLPYDHSWLMARLLKRVKPRLLLITEVEIWPSLLYQCAKRDIPSIVINARMTPRSVRRYVKLGHLFEQTIRLINVISTQSQDDWDAYKLLGAKEQQLQNNGNIKFDIVANETRDQKIERLAQHCRQQSAPLLIAGSTHDPEEQMMINVHQKLHQPDQPLVTCIVPRHPQRFDEVNDMLIASGVPFQRFSEMTEIDSHTQIVLVDAMGLMQGLFAIADIAFVGGSFAQRGGHNALEPALFKVPIVMGPSQFNNPQITAKLTAAGALKTAEDETVLFDTICMWLADKNLRVSDGAKGLGVIEQNRGALNNNLKLIEGYIAD